MAALQPSEAAAALGATLWRSGARIAPGSDKNSIGDITPLYSDFRSCKNSDQEFRPGILAKTKRCDRGRTRILRPLRTAGDHARARSALAHAQRQAHRHVE